MRTLGDLLDPDFRRVAERCLMWGILWLGLRLSLRLLDVFSSSEQRCRRLPT